MNQKPVPLISDYTYIIRQFLYNRISAEKRLEEPTPSMIPDSWNVSFVVSGIKNVPLIQLNIPIALDVSSDN